MCVWLRNVRAAAKKLGHEVEDTTTPACRCVHVARTCQREPGDQREHA